MNAIPPEARAKHQSQTPVLPCTTCPGRNLNLCQPLGDAQLPELLALGGRRTWRRRDLLFRAGDPITVFFKITKGVVAVSRILDDGRRQIVALRITGDCVGYLHTDGRYTFEGHALTDVEACTFHRNRFDTLAACYPALAAATASTLAAALTQAAHSMATIGRLRSTERVANFFAEMHALFEERTGVTRSFPLDLNRSEVADYIGLTLETVSRSIGKLRKRGLIAFGEDDAVIVLDVERLRALGKFRC